MPLLGPNPIALRPLELTSLYGPRDILQLAAPRARSRRLPDRTRRISLTKSTSPVSVRLAKRTQFGCACNPRGAPRAPASPILTIRPTSNSIHSEKSISFTSTGRIQRFIDVLALRAASIDSYCVGFLDAGNNEIFRTLMGPASEKRQGALARQILLAASPITNSRRLIR
jgi:hypothetical protein